MEKKINVYAGNYSSVVEISIPLKESNLEGVTGAKLPKDQSLWAVLSQHLTDKYSQILDTVCKEFNETNPCLNFKFLKWTMDLGENVDTQIPQELLADKDILVYVHKLKDIAVLQNKSDFGASGAVINTQYGCVLTVTIGDRVVFEDLVEPVYDTVEKEVDLSSTQSEALDREEEEEVVVEPSPTQHQTFVEEYSSLELVVCQNASFLIGFDVDKVILANEALWQRYSLSGTNALW